MTDDEMERRLARRLQDLLTNQPASRGVGGGQDTILVLVEGWIDCRKLAQDLLRKPIVLASD